MALKDRVYAKTLEEARQIFKAKVGVSYSMLFPHPSGVRIYTLKKPYKTKTRKYYIGTYMDYINRA